MLAEVLADLAHRNRRTGQVSDAGSAGDPRGIDLHLSLAVPIAARGKLRRHDRVGDHDRAIDARDGEVVGQREERNVSSIGDVADPEPLVQEERALDEVVVPRQVEGAAVAEVGDHREPGIDRRLELIERRVAVAGRYRDPLPREERRRRQAGVALRSQRHQPHEATARRDDPRGVVHIRRHDLRRVMGAGAARLATQERPLDVEAGDHPGDHRVAVTVGDQAGEFVADALDRVGDHRRQDAPHAVGGELVAGPATLLDREAAGAEIGPGVAVHLDVEVAHHEAVLGD